MALPGHSEHGHPPRQAIDFINEDGINVSIDGSYTEANDNGGNTADFDYTFDTNTVSSAGGDGFNLSMGGTFTTADDSTATFDIALFDNEAPSFLLTEIGPDGELRLVDEDGSQGAPPVTLAPNTDGGEIAASGNNSGGGAPNVTVSGTIDVIDPADVDLP